ncbi:MAG: DUF898 family protein [Verrucomicrobiaceae bacterium]|nr:DUF898 family protein [Verrucomicrobiaceae bacterium]
MEKWFYTVNGEQFGPMTAEALRNLETQGSITSATLVWSEDLPAWTPLGFVPGHLLPGGAGVAAPLPEAVGGPEREHRFEFRGRAGEFFRIWIVNVVLTVLTLGIYAAWAKVRTKRYFHGNTLLDGKPFDFTGNPISILKGNLIFGGFFVIYTIAGSVFPPLALAVMLLIGALAPWLIHKAMRFRAHNTVYRNVRFRFRGATGEAYAVFLGWPILVGLTLGILGPYVQFRQRKYYLGNMAWGRADAVMHGGAGFFYKMFFKIVGIILLLALLGSLAVPAVSAYMEKSKAAAGEVRFSGTAPAPAEVDDTELDDEGSLAGPELPVALQAGLFGLFIGAYLLMFLLFTWYQVRTNNYCINTTRWGTVGRLDSRVRVRDLMWLYFTNGIAVLLTLGLMIPWVKVRMARYRAERTVFLCSGSLDAVTASMAADESAIGDAGADVFDFDIGF